MSSFPFEPRWQDPPFLFEGLVRPASVSPLCGWCAGLQVFTFPCPMPGGAGWLAGAFILPFLRGGAACGAPFPTPLASPSLPLWLRPIEAFFFIPLLHLPLSRLCTAVRPITTSLLPEVRAQRGTLCSYFPFFPRRGRGERPLSFLLVLSDALAKKVLFYPVPPLNWPISFPSLCVHVFFCRHSNLWFLAPLNTGCSSGSRTQDATPPSLSVENLSKLPLLPLSPFSSRLRPPQHLRGRAFITFSFPCCDLFSFSRDKEV